MKIINRFSNVTGLGINFTKTQGITSATDGGLEKWAASKLCVWQPFKIVLRYKYLGFLIGKWTSQKHIFKAAFNKYRNRMAAYSPTFRRLSPAKQIPLYNTFVFPLFSYLASTYSIPALGSISENSVRKVVSKVVISYGGRALTVN